MRVPMMFYTLAATQCAGVKSRWAQGLLEWINLIFAVAPEYRAKHKNQALGLKIGMNFRPRRVGNSSKARLSLLVLLMQLMIAWPASEAHSEQSLPDHVVASWDFTNDLDGWAQSTWEEIGAQVYVEGGELRGRVPRSDRLPRFDSPIFKLDADDKHTVLMRIKHDGQVPRGARVDVRLMDPISYSEDFQALPRAFGGGLARIVSVKFDEEVYPDGRYHIIKARIHEKIQGVVIQFRLFPIQVDDETTFDETYSTFTIDWIRIVTAPTIEKVEGCLNKYFDEKPVPFASSQIARRASDSEYVFRGGHANGTNSVAIEAIPSNADGHLLYRSTFGTADEKYRYSTTFNCPRASATETRIRITGKNFGNYETLYSSVVDALEDNGINNPEWNTVTIDGQICSNVVMVEDERVLECSLPSTNKTEYIDRVPVQVWQPDYRTLSDIKHYLSYVVPAPQPLLAPGIANLGARAVDLYWNAPENYWDAATVTGYMVVVYIEPWDPYYKDNVPGRLPSDREDRYIILRQDVVGNVTSTSVVNLEPSRNYRFALKALVEDVRNSTWDEVDLYGRRGLVTGFVESLASNLTEIVTTLAEDVAFSKFSAGLTLDDGPSDNRTMVGPSRNSGGEGHYGLRLVGNAQLENCNASTACCDYSLNGTCEIICVSSSSTVGIDPDYVNFVSDREEPSNDQDDLDALYVGPPRPEDLAATATSDGVGNKPLPSCGPALRLTPSRPRTSGAAWYPRQMNVREGFVTEFTFRISNPSLTCTIMDDESTHCRSRGADGLAFVIQTDGENALGESGMGMGFAGMTNAIAVEFDTFHNPEMRDPYENHIAVFATEKESSVTAGHNLELASSVKVTDLTQGSHRVKIEYSPRFDEQDLVNPSFVASAQVANLMTTDVAWSFAVGSLKVYIDDLHRPVLVTMVNLDAIMELQSGRAWVGFTAATGDGFWQAHEILDWTFQSARVTSAFTYP